jgi:uncharacterized membrane protein YkvA (DUF1232 family)
MRPILKKWFTVLACLVYVISPIDLLPEAFLGPFGVPDDVAAILVAIRTLRKKEPT